MQQCCTVKLVLQPLLENAIYYGMEYMDGEGEILVKGYEKDRDIYLEVQDNGLGMPEEEAAKLLTESSRERKRGSGVGLINVDSRIRLRFGKEYGLLIESHPTRHEGDRSTSRPSPTRKKISSFWKRENTKRRRRSHE